MKMFLGSVDKNRTNNVYDRNSGSRIGQGFVNQKVRKVWELGSWILRAIT